MYNAKDSPNEEKARIEYVKAKRMAKKSLALAQQNEKHKLAEKLHTNEGKRNEFKVAKQMINERKIVIGVNCLKNENGKVVVEPDVMKPRWKDYM